MLIDLSGRVALVTGAARGIGKVIAVTLANSGADIALNDVDSAGLASVADTISSSGRRVVVVPGDVSNRSQVEGSIGKTVESLNEIDVLVNNAGVVLRKPFEDYLEEEWDRVIDINLKGVFNFCHAVGRRMISRRYGKIINIASIMGEVALPPRAAYTATKGAIIALTKNLGAEWAKYNINVNSISPGWTTTEMTRTYFAQPDVNQFLLDRIPLRRFGDPADVANLAVFLASDLSSYITGQNIFVDGGWTIM